MFLQRLLFRKYLDKKETIIHVVHRHWITVQKKMIKIALFGYITPICIIVFIMGALNPANFIFYGWIAVAFFYSIYAFFDYYLDAWLVTDLSIIDTRWDGFFRQRSSRVDYESIESVDVDFKGFKESFFNYGTITLIRSSGIHLTMERVYKPQMASHWISKVMSEIIGNKGVKDSEAIKHLLADIIQDHIRVNS